MNVSLDSRPFETVSLDKTYLSPISTFLFKQYSSKDIWTVSGDLALRYICEQ